MAALIGLAGTLGVAVLGYQQWRKTQRSASVLADERRRATKELWALLEDAHLALRHGGIVRAKPKLVAVNEGLLRNTPYLNQALLEEARVYADTLVAFDNLLRNDEDPEDPDTIEAWELTRRRDFMPPGGIRAVDEAYRAMDTARDRVAHLIATSLA